MQMFQLMVPRLIKWFDANENNVNGMLLPSLSSSQTKSFDAVYTLCCFFLLIGHPPVCCIFGCAIEIEKLCCSF